TLWPALVLSNLDKRILVHPPKLIEQLGPPVIPFKKLKAAAAAVAQLEERTITGLVPEHEPLPPSRPLHNQRPPRIPIRRRRTFKVSVVTTEDIILREPHAHIGRGDGP